MVSSLSGAALSVVVGKVEFPDTSSLYNLVKDDFYILSHLPLNEQEIEEVNKHWKEEKYDKKAFCENLFKRLLSVQQQLFSTGKNKETETHSLIVVDSSKYNVLFSKRSDEGWRNRSVSAFCRKSEPNSLLEEQRLSKSQTSATILKNIIEKKNEHEENVESNLGYSACLFLTDEELYF